MELPIKTERLYITGFDKNMAESVHVNSLDGDNRRFLPDLERCRFLLIYRGTGTLHGSKQPICRYTYNTG